MDVVPAPPVPHAVGRMDACIGALRCEAADAVDAARAEQERAREALRLVLRGGAADARTLAALDAEVGAAGAALARAEAREARRRAETVHLERAWLLARRALLGRAAPFPERGERVYIAEGAYRGETGTVVQARAVPYCDECDVLVDIGGHLVVVERGACDPADDDARERDRDEGRDARERDRDEGRDARATPSPCFSP